MSLHREEGYSRTPGPSEVVLRLTIKFTVELEKDGTLAFLDTLLRRKDDGSLDVTIYRKPVHTDWYLNIQPRHPSHVKRGLVLCLYDRAKSITISQNNLRKDDHITEVLKWNGYPGAFILCCSFPPPPSMWNQRRETGPLW